MIIPELLDKCVLVVDDFETMRKVTAQQLRDLGAERVLMAREGYEAMRVLEAHRVDLVLSDWNMPGLNGLELLRSMRRDVRLRSLPFMMVTAEAARERVQQAIETDVSGMLIKPYTQGRFAECVQRALAWRPRGEMPTEISIAEKRIELAEPPRAGGILVVDDTPENLELMVPLFGEAHRVRTATDGARALAICLSEDPPELVLLDVMMPGMSGFEVAQRLREHPATEVLPIIFVSAMDDEVSRMKGLGLGAVDFVSKPIEPEVLRLRVDNFMRYAALQRRAQGECDALLEVARLRDEVDQLTRHDIKGPLAGIASMTETLLKDGRLSDLQHSYLRSIETCTQQVLDTIGLSTELYKIETGRFVLDPQEFDIVVLLRDIADITRNEVRSRNLSIRVSVPDESDPCLMILGDHVLSHSLLHNLLRNACEAAPRDTRIDIVVSEDSHAQISIKNFGMPPPEVRERFFEKYVTSGKRGGTGLGTYSARLLTQAQNGSIAVRIDEPGNTTELVVRLPLAEQGSATALNSQQSSAPSMAPVLMDLQYH
ncbi:response regulator [Niveibacterium sp. SC-1]|uniref:ATP-binding response regulator n=1 Tax=Niveibacterium sp. SC-1 TaxID=3135646 RepID=UPI00311F7F2D